MAERGLNTFPLIIAVRDDGKLDATFAGIETKGIGAADRMGRAFEAAGRRANGAFSLDGPRREIDGLSQQVSSLIKSYAGIGARSAQGQFDPFGVSNLRGSGVQKLFDAQMSSVEALDREKARAHQSELARIQAEAAALASLNAQRAAAAAAIVAPPNNFQETVYFDPKGSQAAATAARAQANALEQVAAAARTVAAATATATNADQAFAAAATQAATAAGIEAARLETLALTQSKVSAAGIAANTNFTQSTELATTSVRGQRFATIQASQQFQDFFIQIQGGQNPLVAFSQQASQLAFVMTGAGGAAGKFANFFAGPWGTLILIGLSAVTLLTAGLFDNKEAANEAEAAAKKFADRQNDIKNFIDATTGALTEQNKTLVQNAILLREGRIAKNDEESRKGRDAAFSAARQARIIAPDFGDQYAAERGGGTVSAGVDPAINAAIRNANGDVAKLADNFARLVKTRPELKGLLTDTSTAAGQAVVLARENQQIAKEISALRGNKNATFEPGAVENLISVASATDRYSRRIAELRIEREKLRTSAVKPGANVDRAEYIAAAAAIDKQIAAQEKLRSDAAKSARSGSADAKRQAGERRQELFAEAAAIGDGADAIKAANSEYAAQITRLKNQLREGLISDAAAKDAAVKARELRNAAIETAQAAEKLDGALQSIGQQFDGESSFLNRIQKAEAAVKAARKLIDPLTGEATIGKNRYTEKDFDAKDAQLATEKLRPITEATRQLDEQRQIQQAILSGDESEADFLRLKFSILQSYGTLNAQDRAALEAKIGPLKQILDAEFARSQEIERRNLLIGVQVRAAQNLQAAVTDLFTNPFKAGGLEAFGNTLTQIRQRKVAEQLSIELFGGDLGSQVEQALTRGLDPAASKFDTATDKFGTAVDRLLGQQGPSAAAKLATPTAFGKAGGLLDLALPGGGAAKGGASPEADIVVYAPTQKKATEGGAAAQTKAATDRASLQQISKQTLALTLLASAVGGKGGAAINAFANIDQYNQIGDKISKAVGGKLGGALGGAFKGLGVGQAVGAGFDLLGIKGAGTGSQIGGALGGAASQVFGKALGALGPVAGLIGSVVGGLFSALFTKTPTGSAGISTSNGSAVAGGATGTSAELRRQATGLAGSVADSINTIAQTLGGQVNGTSNVKIGTYDNRIRVNPTGGDVGGKNNKQAVDFGKDEKGAIEFAVKDAINDGIITGLRDSTKRIIQAGTDLNRQLQKAVDFENVFIELKSYLDPVGAAIDAVNRRFDLLRQTFAEASASTEEYSQLEELYAIKRKEAVEKATKELTGTLQSLLDDLRFKGDSGLSLRTREANAAASFNPLADKVRRGEKVDQEAFAAAARSYIDISRQLFGSTTSYFDRLSDVTALTGRAITLAGGVVQGGPTGAVGANDNASLAASVAASIAAGFDNAIPADRAALFTSAQFTEAVAAALRDPGVIAANAANNGLSSGGGGQSSNRDVVDAVNAAAFQIREQTAVLSGRLDLIADNGTGGPAMATINNYGSNSSLRNA